MAYVMVPVPEELAEKVLTYVSWKGRPSLAPAPEANDEGPGASGEHHADPGSGGGPIARALATLDGHSRTLLSVISTAALDDDPLTVPEAARLAGMSRREVVGTIMEVNALIASEGGSRMAVFLTALLGDQSPDFTWDDGRIAISEPIARELAGLTRAAPHE